MRDKKKKNLEPPFLARLVQLLGSHGFLCFLTDKAYIKLLYKLSMKKRLNLKNPKTYTEKLQWIKLFDRREEYTMMADKYLVRDYVEKQIGSQYLIPLLGAWDNPEDIDYNSLPNEFVLKCNHDSGGVVICRDKNTLDIEKTNRFLKKRLKRNFYWAAREWPYKNIKRKIICEKFMVDESGYELKDYKFFCFDGVCKAAFIATDRLISEKSCHKLRQRTGKALFNYLVALRYQHFLLGNKNAYDRILIRKVIPLVSTV